MRKARSATLLGLALVLAAAAGAAAAERRSQTLAGELFYTTSAPPAVKRVRFSFDGSTLRFGVRRLVASPPAADGIVFTPAGKLLVGAKGYGVLQVDPTSGSFRSAQPGVASAFHVAISPTGTKAWTAGLPGPLGQVRLRPFGDGAAQPVHGDDGAVTSLAFAAGKAYYTASDPNGIGSFGEIDMSSFRTTRLIDHLRGAHGMAFDEGTGDLFLFGDSVVLQVDPASPTVVAASRPLPGLHLDQGTVDGHGHALVASNTGELALIDYSATGHIDDPRDRVATAFVDAGLDDVAPLTGLGSKHGQRGSRLGAAAFGAAAAVAVGGATVVVARRRGLRGR